MGGALELDVLDATLLAQLTLGVAAAFGIDNEDVGLDKVKCGKEVDDSSTLVDIGFLNGLDILDHEQTLLLGEHGFTVLVLEIGGIGTNTYIQVTKLGGLLEELYMTAMEEVVATADKNAGRFWLLAVGYWLLGVIHCFLVFCYGLWPFAVGCWVLAIGLWLLAIGFWLLGVGFWA